ncbi:MAG: hypothetical protein GY754_15825 [bacterium]|nr:hypothetical protein [bacterium]
MENVEKYFWFKDGTLIEKLPDGYPLYEEDEYKEEHQLISKYMCEDEKKREGFIKKTEKSKESKKSYLFAINIHYCWLHDYSLTDENDFTYEYSNYFWSLLKNEIDLCLEDCISLLSIYPARYEKGGGWATSYISFRNMIYEKIYLFVLDNNRSSSLSNFLIKMKKMEKFKYPLIDEILSYDKATFTDGPYVFSNSKIVKYSWLKEEDFLKNLSRDYPLHKGDLFKDELELVSRYIRSWDDKDNRKKIEKEMKKTDQSKKRYLYAANIYYNRVIDFGGTILGSDLEQLLSNLLKCKMSLEEKDFTWLLDYHPVGYHRGGVSVAYKKIRKLIYKKLYAHVQETSLTNTLVSFLEKMKELEGIWVGPQIEEILNVDKIFLDDDGWSHVITDHFKVNEDNIDLWKNYLELCKKASSSIPAKKHLNTAFTFVKEIGEDEFGVRILEWFRPFSENNLKASAVRNRVKIESLSISYYAYLVRRRPSGKNQNIQKAFLWHARFIANGRPDIISKIRDLSMIFFENDMAAVGLAGLDTLMNLEGDQGIPEVLYLRDSVKAQNVKKKIQERVKELEKIKNKSMEEIEDSFFPVSSGII